MDWFTSLDGVDELESAEAFLDFFGIPYEAAQVRSKRLHIMHHFNQQIKKAKTDRCLTEQDRFLLAKTLLTDSYQTFHHQEVKEHSTLGVYSRLTPSFVTFAQLQEVCL
jgi:nitrogenase-stabilizing/protective protein